MLPRRLSTTARAAKLYAPVRTAAPCEQPLTLAEVKAHCRVDGDDDDALLTGLLASAVDHLDGYRGILGRALVAQTWRQDFDGFDSILRLPLPAAFISKISWRNVSGTATEVTSASYALRADSLGSYVEFADGFAAPVNLASRAAVSVEYIAGTAPADVPPALKAAILLLVGHWYANRETVNVGNISTALPFTVDALIAPFQRVGV